jgi:flagellar hook-associated protein 1 FlgK
MSGLTQSLSIATSGLTAARLGLDVAGQNIANVNTEGYTRRLLTLRELAPLEPLEAGRGVDVLDIRAARDQYIETRLNREQTDSSRDAALVGGLLELESTLGLPGSSIDERLGAFFDSFQHFSVDVSSPSARDAVVREGALLAESFNQLDARLVETARNADQDIRSGIAEVNRLSERIAALNAQMTSGAPDLETLRDERNRAIAELSKLTGVALVERSDGMLDITTPGGAALVIGTTAYPIEVISSPPAGHASLRLHDTDVTNALSGRLGGLINLRDVVVPGYRSALDSLAYDVATSVNTAHLAGFDASGAAAGTFFVPPAAVAGTAGTLTVRAALAADSSLLAGSATGSAGDNGTARAIANLRDQRLAVGGTATPEEAWSQFVYSVGADLSGARASISTREQVLLQLQRFRDSVSGVSLDEEAAHLMRYQRSYEANARFFTTIVDTLDTLMQMVK